MSNLLHKMFSLLEYTNIVYWYETQCVLRRCYKDELNLNLLLQPKAWARIYALVNILKMCMNHIHTHTYMMKIEISSLAFFHLILLDLSWKERIKDNNIMMMRMIKIYMILQLQGLRVIKYCNKLCFSRSNTNLKGQRHSP